MTGDLFEPFGSDMDAQRKELRPYQIAAIREVYGHLARGTNRVCLCLATGSGKTLTSARIVRDAVGRGKRVTFCVPAIALIDQTVAAFEEQGLGPIGVIQGDHPRVDPCAPIQVASVQTLAKRGAHEADVVIVDEAHVEAKAIRAWMEASPTTAFIGLTATPGRARMRDEYDALVMGVGMRQLIDEGHLSTYRVFAPSGPDMSRARTVAGDFHKDDAAEAMDDPKLTADIVETWLTRAAGLPTLLFAVNRAHAGHLRAAFQSVGVECGYQDAFTDAVERRHIAREFAAGRLKIVANVGTLTTGVDWDVRCAIIARPTQSKMLWVQILGRALRTAEGKTHAMILDHAGNAQRLGFPTDIDWSEFPEKGKPKPKAEKREPMPKACGQCAAVMPPKAKQCPFCGHEAGPPEGFIEVEDGELVEIGADGEPVRSKPGAATKADKQAWWSSILAIAAKRGRSRGWASHTYRARFGVWPRLLADDVARVPEAEVAAYVRSRDIAYAKRQRPEAAQAAGAAA